MHWFHRQASLDSKHSTCKWLILKESIGNATLCSHQTEEENDGSGLKLAARNPSAALCGKSLGLYKIHPCFCVCVCVWIVWKTPFDTVCVFDSWQTHKNLACRLQFIAIVFVVRKISDPFESANIKLWTMQFCAFGNLEPNAPNLSPRWSTGLCIEGPLHTSAGHPTIDHDRDNATKSTLTGQFEISKIYMSIRYSKVEKKRTYFFSTSDIYILLHIHKKDKMLPEVLAILQHGLCRSFSTTSSVNNGQFVFFSPLQCKVPRWNGVSAITCCTNPFFCQTQLRKKHCFCTNMTVKNTQI